MEESSTYLCNKYGKCFNHKTKLEAHKKYQHPKSASMPRQSENFDKSKSGTVKSREFSNANEQPGELHLAQGTNVEIVEREAMELKNEDYQEMHEIPLQTSVSLSGDKSGPVLNDSDHYQEAQEQHEIGSQERSFQNENTQPSTGNSPSSDPPSKAKDSKNVKRKRYESDVLREPQNELIQISTPPKFAGTLPEESCDGVDTLICQSPTKKQPYKLEETLLERRHSCKICDYRTNYSSNLRDHERTHTGEKPYKCQHCSYSATVITTLRRHQRTHTGETPYQCGSCDYTAKSWPAMSYHLKTHAGEKPFKCQHCEYSSTLSSQLKTHERTHTGEKPFKCKHCSYSATSSSTLRNHERTHTGEKPYRCKYCSYRATQSSTLRMHERTHTGEKPYKCQYCDYSSTTASYLRDHELTHTGEKPYQCGSCDYTAKSRGAMSYHLKIHAGEKRFKC